LEYGDNFALLVLYKHVLLLQLTWLVCSSHASATVFIPGVDVWHILPYLHGPQGYNASILPRLFPTSPEVCSWRNCSGMSVTGLQPIHL